MKKHVLELTDRPNFSEYQERDLCNWKDLISNINIAEESKDSQPRFSSVYTGDPKTQYLNHQQQLIQNPPTEIFSFQCSKKLQATMLVRMTTELFNELKNEGGSLIILPDITDKIFIEGIPLKKLYEVFPKKEFEPVQTHTFLRNVIMNTQLKFIESDSRKYARLFLPPYSGDIVEILDVNLIQKLAIVKLWPRFIDQNTKSISEPSPFDYIRASKLGYTQCKINLSFDKSNTVQGYLFKDMKFYKEFLIMKVDIECLTTWSTYAADNEFEKFKEVVNESSLRTINRINDPLPQKEVKEKELDEAEIELLNWTFEARSNLSKSGSDEEKEPEQAEQVPEQPHTEDLQLETDTQQTEAAESKEEDDVIKEQEKEEEESVTQEQEIANSKKEENVTQEQEEQEIADSKEEEESVTQEQEIANSKEEENVTQEQEEQEIADSKEEENVTQEQEEEVADSNEEEENVTQEQEKDEEAESKEEDEQDNFIQEQENNENTQETIDIPDTEQIIDEISAQTQEKEEIDENLQTDEKEADEEEEVAEQTNQTEEVDENIQREESHESEVNEIEQTLQNEEEIDDNDSTKSVDENLKTEENIAQDEPDQTEFSIPDQASETEENIIPEKSDKSEQIKQQGFTIPILSNKIEIDNENHEEIENDEHEDHDEKDKDHDGTWGIEEIPEEVEQKHQVSIDDESNLNIKMHVPRIDRTSINDPDANIAAHQKKPAVVAPQSTIQINSFQRTLRGKGPTRSSDAQLLSMLGAKPAPTPQEREDKEKKKFEKQKKNAERIAEQNRILEVNRKKAEEERLRREEEERIRREKEEEEERIRREKEAEEERIRREEEERLRKEEEEKARIKQIQRQELFTRNVIQRELSSRFDDEIAEFKSSKTEYTESQYNIGDVVNHAETDEQFVVLDHNNSNVLVAPLQQTRVFSEDLLIKSGEKINLMTDKTGLLPEPGDLVMVNNMAMQVLTSNSNFCYCLNIFGMLQKITVHDKWTRIPDQTGAKDSSGNDVTIGDYVLTSLNGLNYAGVVQHVYANRIFGTFWTTLNNQQFIINLVIDSKKANHI